ALFQIVAGRIIVEVVKHFFRIIRSSVIGGPGGANGKQVIAQHIKHTDLRDGHAGQLWTLRHGSTYQQSAVGAAYNSQLFRAGIIVIDQIFGGSNKIIKDILFLHFDALLVPACTIFTAATQIGYGKNTAHFQPRDPPGAERRGQTDVKSTITVQQGWLLSIEFYILSMYDKHRNFRAVLTFVEYLLSGILPRIKGHLRLFIERR